MGEWVSDGVYVIIMCVMVLCVSMCVHRYVRMMYVCMYAFV